MPLPSTDFLNLCIHMYFTKFHPSFPIVHAPTFRPSSKSSLLLLSICSIGSLFVGSSHAASQGLKIFETLNKAILASWEKDFSKEGSETIAMIQAALIGQTFGLLSEAKRSAHCADIPWHSHCGRLLAGIHVHDVEISELFLTDPYLRHSRTKLPLLSDDDLWAATTVEDWDQMVTSRLKDSNLHESNPRSPGTSVNPVPSLSTSPSHGFRSYIDLERLATLATEAKVLHDSTEQKSLEGALMTFHDSYIGVNRGQTSDPYCLPVLWHSIFISLYVNTNRLELVIGKEGFTEAQNHVAYARSWASSPDGQRCALHAALILRELQQKNLGTEPPMHVPRIIFRATLVWFCYTNFGSDTASSHQSAEFPELQQIGVNARMLLFEANGFKPYGPTTSESSIFCGLVDILPRVGHWGISQLFGLIVNLLLPGVKDNERYAG
ncbi:unnamed protein product [Penicillium salamii]|nr:unnamed protein product [Penicillium salamii]